MAAHTDNFIVINAPLATVWEITNDVANWPSLFTEYSEATILEQKANTVRFRVPPTIDVLTVGASCGG